MTDWSAAPELVRSSNHPIVIIISACAAQKRVQTENGVQHYKLGQETNAPTNPINTHSFVAAARVLVALQHTEKLAGTF